MHSISHSGRGSGFQMRRRHRRVTAAAPTRSPGPTVTVTARVVTRSSHFHAGMGQELRNQEFRQEFYSGMGHSRSEPGIPGSGTPEGGTLAGVLA